MIEFGDPKDVAVTSAAHAEWALNLPLDLAEFGTSFQIVTLIALGFRTNSTGWLGVCLGLGLPVFWEFQLLPLLVVALAERLEHFAKHESKSHSLKPWGHIVVYLQ